ncbi:hypothetical protein [Mycobacterium avium]|uniref:hypothetical protein n=1 Tax=Mycobacterium avium TaxID=1764 RepID=UPI0007A021E0|nr:hypothetical protein [Mycobacterium avium]
MSFGSSRRSKSSVNAEHAGRRDNVPATRLRGPWSSVAAYDDLMANWQRLNDYEIDDTEEVAAGEVFDGLIPKEVATYYDSFVRNGATVRDSDALERLMRQPMSDILEQVQWFKRGASRGVV